MKNKEKKLENLIRKIFDEIGGKGNIHLITHCMTRVRLKIIDKNKIKKENLERLSGILGVVEGEELQIIVGPGKSNQIAQKMAEIIGTHLDEIILDHNIVSTKEKPLVTKKNTSRIKRMIKNISHIFIPMIPALIGSGLIAGFEEIIHIALPYFWPKNYFDSNSLKIFLNILNVLKTSLFSYLVIYAGINAAKVFGSNQTLGGVVGGIIMLNGIPKEGYILNIFTGEKLLPQQGGILGVIFSVWIFSIIEKKLHKMVPESIDNIVTPTISLLLVGLLEILLVMPLAGLISEGLMNNINWLVNMGGPFSGFILATFFLPIVMTGLHHIFIPIHIQMITETGSTSLLPIFAMAGAGQVGAGLAIWVRLRKDKKLVNVIKASLLAGILGIGEPMIYGVTLPLGRPFITACIGGGIGGIFTGLIGQIGSIGIGPSGIALIPLIIHGKLWAYVISLMIAYLSGFLITFFFGTQKEKLT